MPTASRSPAPEAFKKATTDPIQIRAWWRKGEYLIGLPMGFASGVCCIDVDTSEDHADGVAEWHKIAAQHEPIVTREHRSATGGPHLIFDFDWPIGCSSGKLPKGIEVKGQGGYIVVPPSRRKGRAYTVHHDIDPAPLPLWLRDLITAGRQRTPGLFTARAWTPSLTAARSRPTPRRSPRRWRGFPTTRTLVGTIGSRWRCGSMRRSGMPGSSCSTHGRSCAKPSTTRTRRSKPGSRSWPRRRTTPAPGRYSSHRTPARLDSPGCSNASPPTRRATMTPIRHGARPQCGSTHSGSGPRPITPLYDAEQPARRSRPTSSPMPSRNRPAPPVEAMRVDTGIGKTEAAIVSHARGGCAARSPPAASSTRWTGTCWATRSTSASPRWARPPRCSVAAAQTTRTTRDRRCASCSRRGWRWP